MGEVQTRLSEAISQAAGHYHRLVLLVGPFKSGKTAALRDLAKSVGYPLLNVNLELSKRMLDLPRSQRPMQVSRLLQGLIGAAPGEVVLLDNLEVLFDPALEVEPLRLLQASSRNRTLVAAWCGEYQGGTLTYAEPSHPEFAKFNQVEALVLTAGQS
jgi:hypothetical protein